MHDLRGPLTTIAGFADLMSLADDGAERRRMFEEIQRQVDRLQQISADTLAYARGERALLLRPVLMSELATELEQVLRRELCGTNVVPTVEVRYRGKVRCDDPQLLRVAENLARNARQAMSHGVGSRFTLRIFSEGNELVLRFEDDGPGFPEAVRARLFKPFVAGQSPGGSGLGLSIVKAIAEQHGGTAAHVPTPRGACIELRLPVL